jgi:hypothetical protein
MPPTTVAPITASPGRLADGELPWGAPVDLRNLLWKRDLRLWRAAISERSARLAEVLAAPATAGLAREFAGRKTEKGRRRIVNRLIKLFGEGAEFEVARLVDPPRAMWSFVALEPDGGARVDYVGIGDGQIVSGPWNLLASEHALERFYQRLPPGADLSAALRQAHANAVAGQLYREPWGDEVLAPSGSGAFLGAVVAGGLDSRGIVKVWSWVHRDALSARRREWLAQRRARMFTGDD